MVNTSLGLVLPTVQQLRPLSDKAVLIQVLIGIFLYINSLMIFTVFKKEGFYTTTRYIFFAHTLICDSLYLALTDALLLMTFSRLPMPGGLCLCLCVIAGNLTFATPLTLTAMSLERYVAICMPLRHSELSTPVRAMHCILLIQALSTIYQLVMLCVVFLSASLRFYTSPMVCSIEQTDFFPWQKHVRSAVFQICFLIMSLVIAVTYVKIMVAARAFSSERKNSSNKSQRTVILHAIQLLLCLTQFWCPMIETVIIKIDLYAYVQIRYFNYLVFMLAPRCLSPLVYGVRDKDFAVVLRNYALFGYSEKVFQFLFKKEKANRKGKQKKLHTGKVHAGTCLT